MHRLLGEISGLNRFRKTESTSLNNGTKFYSKSLLHMVSILEMIDKNFLSGDIARSLDMKKSHIWYYITKAKENGYLDQIAHDTDNALQLTQLGKKFVDRYTRNYTKINCPLPICRAENIQFKTDIIEMATIPSDWKKVTMHNWIQYISVIDGIRVKLNLGKRPSLLLLPQPVEGNDPFNIFVVMVFGCVQVIIKLNDIFGLKVGPLQLGSRGEWLAYDPVAKVFCKTNGQVTYEGIAKVNASSPRSIGELEFFQPQALLSYLLMPERVARIETRIENMEAMLWKVIQNADPNFNQMSSQTYLQCSFSLVYLYSCRIFPIFVI